MIFIFTFYLYSNGLSYGEQNMNEVTYYLISVPDSFLTVGSAVDRIEFDI